MGTSATETQELYPPIPEQVPRFGASWSCAIGRFLLRSSGWRVTGEFHNIPKTVVAAAPHTSNWDFILAMFAVCAMGVKISYLMKKEAFIWPLRGLFIALGGVPIDRSAAIDIVDQVADSFQKADKLWLVITPEGTRAKVDKWKTGFLRIAHKAGVPVSLVVWDYPNRQIRLETLWPVSENYEQDAADIRQYVCERYRGKYPQNQ